MEKKRFFNTHQQISSGPNLINWQEDYSVFHPQSSDALPMYLGHYLRGIYPAVSKYGHTYPNHAIAQFKENTILKNKRPRGLTAPLFSYNIILIITRRAVMLVNVSRNVSQSVRTIAKRSRGRCSSTIMPSCGDWMTPQYVSTWQDVMVMCMINAAPIWQLVLYTPLGVEVCFGLKQV